MYGVAEIISNAQFNRKYIGLKIICIIAAPVHEIADSSCSQLPPAPPHVHEIIVWCQAAMACEA